jgi:hypothetical protein
VDPNSVYSRPQLEVLVYDQWQQPLLSPPYTANFIPQGHVRTLHNSFHNTSASKQNVLLTSCLCTRSFISVEIRISLQLCLCPTFAPAMFHGIPRCWVGREALFITTFHASEKSLGIARRFSLAPNILVTTRIA